MFKRPGNLKGVTGFMKQTELYHTNVGAKVQLHQPLLLIVFLTQMLIKVLTICVGLLCLC